MTYNGEVYKKMSRAAEIDKLYKQCGLKYAEDYEMRTNMRTEMHKGNLNSVLNTNFSNIYGKNISNNLNNMTIRK